MIIISPEIFTFLPKICSSKSSIFVILGEENSGIIKGYTTSLDMRKLGYEWYNLQLKLTENKKEFQLKQFFKQKLIEIYFYKYLGHENWDLDIGVIVKSSSDLREFILELREKFGDIIKIYDMYIIIEETKGNYAPGGVFKKN